MEVMSEFPDGFFDLAIADPPYGIFGTGGGNRQRSGGLKKKMVLEERGLKSMATRRANGTTRQMQVFLTN